MTSFKALFGLHKVKVSSAGFRTTVAALFVLSYCLRGSPLLAVDNRFEVRCHSKAGDAFGLKNLSLLQKHLENTFTVICKKLRKAEKISNREIKLEVSSSVSSVSRITQYAHG